MTTIRIQLATMTRELAKLDAQCADSFFNGSTLTRVDQLHAKRRRVIRKLTTFIKRNSLALVAIAALTISVAPMHDASAHPASVVCHKSHDCGR